MRRSRICVLVVMMDSALGGAMADCTCRARGQEFELGQSVCLQTPNGPRIATCGMVLNNTSWHFSDTPCVVSSAPPRQPASAAGHHRHHGS